MTTALPDQLRADLLVARKARDETAVSALRTALGSLANAEAPPLPDGPMPLGVLGLVEHDRLTLTAEDHVRILRAEVDGRLATAAELDAVDQPAEAARLRAEAAVLARYLP